MAVEASGQVGGDSSAVAEETDESINMLRQATRVFPPEAHVQVVTLAKAPAVTLQVLTEIELGHLGPGRAFLLLPVIQLKLDLLGGDHLLGPDSRAHGPGDRAEVPA